MVTYGESRADGGRIVLTHVVFPLTGCVSHKFAHDQVQMLKELPSESYSRKKSCLRCYPCVGDGFLTTAP